MIERGNPHSKITLHDGTYRKAPINPTTKYLGIQTTGKLNPCEHCARQKIRQANIPKKFQR